MGSRRLLGLVVAMVTLGAGCVSGGGGTGTTTTTSPTSIATTTTTATTTTSTSTSTSTTTTAATTTTTTVAPPPPPGSPVVSVGDAAVVEGDSGSVVAKGPVGHVDHGRRNRHRDVRHHRRYRAARRLPGEDGHGDVSRRPSEQADTGDGLRRHDSGEQCPGQRARDLGVGERVDRRRRGCCDHHRRRRERSGHNGRGEHRRRDPRGRRHRHTHVEHPGHVERARAGSAVVHLHNRLWLGDRRAGLHGARDRNDQLHCGPANQGHPDPHQPGHHPGGSGADRGEPAVREPGGDRQPGQRRGDDPGQRSVGRRRRGGGKRRAGRKQRELSRRLVHDPVRKDPGACGRVVDQRQRQGRGLRIERRQSRRRRHERHERPVRA